MSISPAGMGTGRGLTEPGDAASGSAEGLSLSRSLGRKGSGGVSRTCSATSVIDPNAMFRVELVSVGVAGDPVAAGEPEADAKPIFCWLSRRDLPSACSGSKAASSAASLSAVGPATSGDLGLEGEATNPWSGLLSPPRALSSCSKSNSAREISTIGRESVGGSGASGVLSPLVGASVGACGSESAAWDSEAAARNSDPAARGPEAAFDLDPAARGSAPAAGDSDAAGCGSEPAARGSELASSFSAKTSWSGASECGLPLVLTARPRGPKPSHESSSSSV